MEHHPSSDNDNDDGTNRIGDENDGDNINISEPPGDFDMENDTAVVWPTVGERISVVWPL